MGNLNSGQKAFILSGFIIFVVKLTFTFCTVDCASLEGKEVVTKNEKRKAAMWPKEVMGPSHNCSCLGVCTLFVPIIGQTGNANDSHLGPHLFLFATSCSPHQLKICFYWIPLFFFHFLFLIDKIYFFILSFIIF